MTLLTEQQAGEAIGVSAKTVRRLVDAGRLEWVNLALKPGKRLIRIPPEALARILPPPSDAPPERTRRRRRRREISPERIW
jgi:excisionase family DNA binding protein